MVPVASLLLITLLAVLTWTVAGGAWGWAYVLAFAAACAPGLPFGFALFGRRHAAGWISGALIGYPLTAIAVWLPVQLNADSVWAALGSWLLLTVALFITVRPARPLLDLQPWTRRDTAALLATLLLVPILVWAPFTSVGEVDSEGNRRYRAYFTADFLWHVALTAELSKLDDPPRNPYLARRALNYYWAYFVPPAVISAAYPSSTIASNLLLNATCAGLLFLAALFLAAWTIVPRAGPVALAVVLTVIAASAEGWHALISLWAAGRPLSEVRNLNIDAVTSWFLEGLSVDGLPRSLWYTPQHAMACGLALIAVTMPALAPSRRPLIGLMAGIPLGLAIIVSPLLGGAFCLVYGGAALWHAVRAQDLVGRLLTTAPASVPALAGLAWCLASETFDGAGGAVAIGVSRASREAPESLVLALGPVLGLAALGFAIGAKRRPLAAPAIALVTGGLAFYFVTLTSEPIWIGWRAGQIILVTLPAALAAALDALLEQGRRRAAAAAVAAVALVGLPTTIIDLYNAQDTQNTALAAGFRWTVFEPPDTRAALEWIRDHTDEDAVVQMSIGSRGRETWTRVPSFAERRMAAGLPISLLRTPEYAEISDRADWIFRAPDPAEAQRIARSLRIDYVYVDRVEREAFGEAAIRKFDDPCCFTRVFAAGAAAVYQVK